MRTAEEVGRTIAQIQAVNDVSGAKLQRSIFNTLRDWSDESIAHGMTIAAEIAHARCGRSDCGSDYCLGRSKANEEILTARDNKVWMKE